MMTDDNWLLEKAQQRKARAAQARQDSEVRQRDEDRHTRIFKEHIDELWGQLQAEVRRQVGVYNDAAEDSSDAIYIVTHPDLIDVRLPITGGNQMAINLNREQRSLSETHHRSTGVYSKGTPSISFTTTDDDRLVFSGGTPAQVAAGLLHKLLD